MLVFSTGSTRTYHPEQYFPELTRELAEKRWEGLINMLCREFTVNGRPAKIEGPRNDTVLISTGQEKQFHITAEYA